MARSLSLGPGYGDKRRMRQGSSQACCPGGPAGLRRLRSHPPGSSLHVKHALAGPAPFRKELGTGIGSATFPVQSLLARLRAGRHAPAVPLEERGSGSFSDRKGSFQRKAFCTEVTECKTHDPASLNESEDHLSLAACGQKEKKKPS